MDEYILELRNSSTGELILEMELTKEQMEFVESQDHDRLQAKITELIVEEIDRLQKWN
jgi:hypothetical protein